MKPSPGNACAVGIIGAFFMSACIVDATAEVDSISLPEETNSSLPIEPVSTEAKLEAETTASLGSRDARARRSDGEVDDALVELDREDESLARGESEEESPSIDVEEEDGEEMDSLWGCTKATAKVALHCSLAAGICIKTRSVAVCAQGESKTVVVLVLVSACGAADESTGMNSPSFTSISWS